MSYEGYYQFICKNGHLSTHDVYAMEPESFKCEATGCGAALAWWNQVNLTNGSFETVRGKEVRIDGYIELTPISETACSKCHSILDRRYAPPRKGGHHEK